MSLSFWEQRWQNQQTGWDLGQVSPPLAAYIDQIPAAEKNEPLLMPGCGSGYEALYLLEKGFSNVTMLDLAPSAANRLIGMLDTQYPAWQESMRVQVGDFFEHEGNYHRILEQTFFCAIDPSWRERYAQRMQHLLIPGGKLAGVLFDRAFEGGPPFGGAAPEYAALFEQYFQVRTLAPCYNSIAPRAGSEVFFIAVKPA